MGTFRYTAVNRRRGRRVYKGSLDEPPPELIPLPPTPGNLRTVLCYGLSESASLYTHQAIAHWCDRLFFVWPERPDASDSAWLGSHAERALEVATDVAAQWELTLASWPGGLAALDGVEASTIRFPQAWFERWLALLDTASSEHNANG